MRCPTIQPTLPIVDQPFALHTRDFSAATVGPLAHGAIVTGARLIARAALKAFLEPGLRTAMKADFIREKNAVE
jgi:hypothetical protein